MGTGGTRSGPGDSWWDLVGSWGDTWWDTRNTFQGTFPAGNAWWDLLGPGQTLGMPGWTLVGPGGTLFRLVIQGDSLVRPGQSWWDLVRPGQSYWDTLAAGQAWWYLVLPVGHFASW